MKRSDELAGISREHHVVLELALRLQRATDADAAEVAGAALAFWRAEGREHFRQEEELMLPAFAAHVPADDPDIVRVLVEHVEVRRRFAGLEGGAAPGAGELDALGKLLHDHVRHEERVLFPRIEEALTPEELTTLGAALGGRPRRG